MAHNLAFCLFVSWAQTGASILLPEIGSHHLSKQSLGTWAYGLGVVLVSHLTPCNRKVVKERFAVFYSYYQALRAWRWVSLNRTKFNTFV